MSDFNLYHQDVVNTIEYGHTMAKPLKFYRHLDFCRSDLLIYFSLSIQIHVCLRMTDVSRIFVFLHSFAPLESSDKETIRFFLSVSIFIQYVWIEETTKWYSYCCVLTDIKEDVERKQIISILERLTITTFLY